MLKRTKAAAKKIFVKPPVLTGWKEMEINGLKWKLLLDRYIDRTIATEKEFEPETTALVKGIVKPGMHILDIGANIGYFSMLFSKITGEKGKIYSFEPVGHLRNNLEWHIANNQFNKRVQVFPFGLSDKSETLEIGIDNVSATLHWVSSEKATSHEKIKLEKLDDIIAKEKINRIDFVKIDIDGHEPFFLKGAATTLTKFKPVLLVEFAQLSLDKAGSDVRELKTMLEELGYVLCSEKTLKPFQSRREFLIEAGNCTHSVNIWAVPKEKVTADFSLKSLF